MYGYPGWPMRARTRDNIFLFARYPRLSLGYRRSSRQNPSRIIPIADAKVALAKRTRHDPQSNPPLAT